VSSQKDKSTNTCEFFRGGRLGRGRGRNSHERGYYYGEKRK